MIISWSEGDVLLKRWRLMFDEINHVTCSGGVEVGELIQIHLPNCNIFTREEDL